MAEVTALGPFVGQNCGLVLIFRTSATTEMRWFHRKLPSLACINTKNYLGFGGAAMKDVG
jgi:hypothetical protein